MARDTYTPVVPYTGAGNLDAYSYSFKITALVQLLIVEYDANGLETQRVRGTDTTYLSPTTPPTFSETGGIVTLAANLTSGSFLKILLADDAPTQPQEYKGKFSFDLEKFEQGLDFVAGAVVRLAYLAQRSMKLSDFTLLSAFDPTLPIEVTDTVSQVIATKADGTGLEIGPSITDIAAAAANATAAAASAAAALASENAASASAANAASSASAASTSATNANASAGAAATSESNAAASAAAASTSETNAATSETNAATSETNAGNSETAAANSASAASTSESNAATSETNASTSETNAASSAAAAAASASQAEAAAQGDWSLWVEHAITNGQAATALADEVIDSLANSSGHWQFEIIRGTTVVSKGDVHLVDINGTWTVQLGAYTMVHGVTWSVVVTAPATVGRLRAALDSGAGNGTIKLSRRYNDV